jgi:asparagine synthase (glutamine-hydrolysing)
MICIKQLNNKIKEIIININKMCGICGILSTNEIDIPINVLHEKFFSIKYRGPEKSICINDDNYAITFHRLPINDRSTLGDQPFNFSYKYQKMDGDKKTIYRRTIYVVCNGEIYNSKELKKETDVIETSDRLNFNYKSRSDCEVLIPLFLSVIKEDYYEEKQANEDENIVNEEENKDDGLFGMIFRLSGEFAFSVYDILTNVETNETTYNLWLGRDRFGIRPLFYSMINDNTVAFGSELKSINFGDNEVHVADPRTWYLFSQRKDKLKKYSNIYYGAGLYKIVQNPDMSDVRRMLKEKLVNAVRKRLHCDREIGCLLSGGFDSSIVSAIAARELLHENKVLRTFSIGMKNSPDTKCAQIVANHIGSVHTTIEIPEEEWYKAIEHVIYITETYDVTTIRATVGQYLISKWIKENTDIKVLLIGDGADELAGGYIYFNNAPNPVEFHLECIRRLHYIHYFDVNRSDKGVSSNGLEARVPFLDEEFVDTYLMVDPKLRVSHIKEIDGKKIRYEKFLLRDVFDKSDYLPKEIIWRKKEAFSDGVSSEGESWHSKYKTMIDDLISDTEYEESLNKITKEPKPYSKEALHYYNIFISKFGDKHDILPYYWMPKWVDNVTDPSARTLKMYDEKDEDNHKHV